MLSKQLLDTPFLFPGDQLKYSLLQFQSQKWAEKLTQLRKDYADLAAITSSRSELAQISFCIGNAETILKYHIIDFTM